MVELTEEQRQIVESSGDAKVEALAGTGKTTTLVHYANHHRADGDILYLVFNRAMRDSAENKFPRNVKVTTAHSLAWCSLGLNGREVNRSFDAHDVMRELKLRNDRTGRFLAKSVLELFRMYCYSSKESPDQAVDPLVEHMGPCRLSNFTWANREKVARMAEKLFIGMRNQSIAQITDDYYFKLFAQEKAASIISRYKIALADEAQDHNEVTADILINSQVPTVFVGDSLQQVYAWRYAVNTLKSVPEFQQFKLTGAFRFGEGIARGVNRVISNLMGERLSIRGLGEESTVEPYDGDQPPLRRGFAYLSRTNGDLLKLAENAMSIDWSLYIEGGVETLQFHMMYHILQLLEGGRPKHPFFALFEDIEELQEYCEAINDRSTLALVGIVKKYKRDLFALETGIRRSQVGDKREADVILTTAHKAKGLEFEDVALLDNFAREIIDAEEEINLDDWRTREEINLLYVAMTRARRILVLPRRIMEVEPKQVKRSNATLGGNGNQLAGRENRVGEDRVSNEWDDGTGGNERRMDESNAVETRVDCRKRVPLRLPPWEKLTPDEQIPIANLPMDQSYIITGGPGTGKTVLAVYRCEQAARTALAHGRDDAVRFLVYNRTLWKFLAAAIGDRDIPAKVVTTWFQFFYSFYLRRTEERVPEIRDFQPDWKEVEAGLQGDAEPVFDHIVIDEAQDLPLPLLRILKQYSKSMTVFFDEQQKISSLPDTPKSLAEAISALDLHERRCSLNGGNFRNTDEVCAVARLFYTGDPHFLPARCHLHGPKPLAENLEGVSAMAKRIISFWASRPEAVTGVLVPPGSKMAEPLFKELIKQVESRNVGSECVQIYLAGGEADLDFGRIGIKVMTYLSAKGLEFDAVFLPEVDHTCLDRDQNLSSNQLYVACSRARQFLSLMYTGRNPRSFSLQLMKQNSALFRWISESREEEPF